MESRGCEPNEHTFTLLFSACADTRDLNVAKDLYSKFASKYQLSNPQAAAAAEMAISMFIKCGSTSHAEAVSNSF